MDTLAAFGSELVVPEPENTCDLFGRLVGTSESLRRAARKARLISQVDAPVLLQGETGVGKDVFARGIHNASSNRRGRFVALNCGGLSRDLLASELFGYVDGAFTGARRAGQVGKIEAANGGTLFLDEIAELPLDLQPFLLRVLEGGEVYRLGSAKPSTVRFRLVAACNRDLRNEVRDGRFRMDLFYRISVTSVQIPPLRERRADVPGLVEHFARDAAERNGLAVKRFAPEVLSAFAHYSWPGNVRELRNVVQAMMLLAEDDVVGLSSLPDDIIGIEELQPATYSGEAHTGLERVERDAIGAAIWTHCGNLSRVARDLCISRSTLYLKMKKYALEPILQEVRRSGSPV
jgi:transcriptional regulator with PAS, ATPase and Fis domain